MPGLNVIARFSFPKFDKPKQGTKQLKKQASNQKNKLQNKGSQKTSGAVKTVQQAGQRLQSTINKAAGYRRSEGEEDILWLPNTERPEWLDGTMPGDRGFDPLGLGKKQEYLQLDIDEQDITAAQNRKGGVVGKFDQNPIEVTQQALQPYTEVFSLPRFRECELIHGRWAMLATLGCVVAEATTGVSWVDAGKVELDQTRYLGFNLPFSITQLVWIEVILVGGAEIYRSSELDLDLRLYPGGPFDPLNLASDPERSSRLKEAEIKHARLAMIAFLGFGIQALATGEGVVGSLEKIALGN